MSVVFVATFLDNWYLWSTGICFVIECISFAFTALADKAWLYHREIHLPTLDGRQMNV